MPPCQLRMGEKMVMRIFDPDILLKTFGQLGLARDDYDRWEKMVENPSGIVLVTGPTGSGKTTTLYTSLKHLATPEINVCTIEDPIEMVEPGFNQMQVRHNINLGFADGVRALLRQDRTLSWWVRFAIWKPLRWRFRRH